MTDTDFFFDPPRFAPSLDEEFEQASSDAYEAWRDAIDSEATAHNEYLRRLSRGWMECLDLAVSARKDAANQRSEVVEAHVDWNLAVAHEKRCRAKVDELRERSIRRMAHDKNVAGQT